MIRSLEAFRIDLVDILSPRRSRRESNTPRTNFQPADRGAVPRRTRKDLLDRLTGKLLGTNLLRREPSQNFLLFPRSSSLNTIIKRLAEFASEVLVDLAGIASHTSRDLRRQQSRDQSVLDRKSTR